MRIVQNVPRSLFTRLADGFIDNARSQGLARAVDQQAVLPDHAATFRSRSLCGCNRKLSFNELPQVVIHRNPLRARQGLESGGNIGF